MKRITRVISYFIETLLLITTGSTKQYPQQIRYFLISAFPLCCTKTHFVRASKSATTNIQTFSLNVKNDIHSKYKYIIEIHKKTTITRVCFHSYVFQYVKVPEHNIKNSNNVGLLVIH